MKRWLSRTERRAPLRCYFAGAFGLSALALAVIGLPRMHGGARPSSALVLFPVMVIGVGVLGLALTAATSGRVGLRQIRARLRWPAGRRWFLALAVCPAAVLMTLETLRALVSPRYAPQLFLFGIPAGLLAGFFEELGWTGFAYPRIRARRRFLPAALLLGALWGLWHLPVVDALGAASPHGTAWPAFFASFVAMIMALRVLIAWVYEHTGSILLAQAIHATSSGALVLFGAAHVTPTEEAAWYFAYACVLAAVTSIVAILYRRATRRRPASVSHIAEQLSAPVAVSS